MKDDDVQQVAGGELLAHLRQQQAKVPDERPARDLGISDAERAAAYAHARLPGWNEAIPARFRDAALEHLTGKALELCQRWVDLASHDGVNLLLSGPVGSGKTYAGVAAMRPLFFGGCSMLFVSMDGLLSMVDWKNPAKAENEELLASVDLLMMDDLGTQRENAWAQEVIFAVVNNRWMEDLPTIASTNLTPKALEDALGERTYSRLTGACVGVRLGGEDRRREGRS